MNDCCRDAVAQAVRDERHNAAEIALAHKHLIPDESKDPLDKMGRYSNTTCDMIARAIRSQPPTTPEPERLERKHSDGTLCHCSEPWPPTHGQGNP